MSRFIKLMDGLTSNASGIEIELNKIIEAKKWDTSSFVPTVMGGFNFSTEEKILRWIHRGDTIYDVEIPGDAEIIDCPSENCPHGVFRSNKIILSNPRQLTESMVMDFYKRSDLPLKSYYQCLVILSQYKNFVNVAKEIIIDKINPSNVDECINEFKRFVSDDKDGSEHEFDFNLLNDNAKFIYEILLEIQKGL